MRQVKLPIQEWLEGKNLGTDADALFEESVQCFKAGAYRAALLMSYLGFQSILRDRILSAGAPAGVPPGMWSSIQSKLRSDDEWDPSVFDATQQKAPAPVFPVSEDLRQQVTYWKNRRNDCAHSKPGPITASHVEAFWVFVRAHSSKFAVNGSIEALLEKLKRHFDASITPPGTDATPLADEFTSIVDARL